MDPPDMVDTTSTCCKTPYHAVSGACPGETQQPCILHPTRIIPAFFNSHNLCLQLCYNDMRGSDRESNSYAKLTLFKTPPIV